MADKHIARKEEDYKGGERHPKERSEKPHLGEYNFHEGRRLILG